MTRHDVRIVQLRDGRYRLQRPGRFFGWRWIGVEEINASGVPWELRGLSKFQRLEDAELAARYWLDFQARPGERVVKHISRSEEAQ